jgi:hypothetical protein
MPLNDQHVRALLVATGETHEEEIDCEGFLDRVAAYAEARAEGRALPASFAKVEAHERLCANCAEESRALVEMLRGEC